MKTGKSRKVLSIMLSLLLVVQTPVMAGELVAEEALMQEEIPVEDVIIEEELPEEGISEEEASELVDEVITDEEMPDGELFEEEFLEDTIIPENTFEEVLAEEPIEAITEGIADEEIDVALPEESLLEEYEPALVGASSGQCGDNVYWSLSDDGVLTISGTGDMYLFANGNGPWSDRRSEITSIIINSGISSIGTYAFQLCRSLTKVTILDGLTSIGPGAFRYCDALTSVTIPNSVTSINDQAFYNCNALTDIYYTGSETEWKAFINKIGDYNDSLLKATVNYNYSIPPTTIQLDPMYEGSLNREFYLSYTMICADQPIIKDIHYSLDTNENNVIWSTDSTSVLNNPLTANEWIISVPVTIKEAGTYNLTVEYNGISEKSIVNIQKELTVTIGDSGYPYTGSAIKPTVISVMAKGGTKLTKDQYSVSYQNNINVGYGKIIVTGKGEYAGLKDEVTFKIVPEKMKLKDINYDLSECVFLWTSVPHFTGKADISWDTLSYLEGNTGGYELRVGSYEIEGVMDSEETVSFPLDCTHEEWTEIPLNTHMKAQVRAFVEIDGERFEGPWSEEKKFTIETDFNITLQRDTWNFVNPSSGFSKTIYTDLFGDNRYADLLYNADHGKHGTCAGMVNAMLCIVYGGSPNIESFGKHSLIDVNKKDVCSELNNITALQLIEYAHAYTKACVYYDYEIDNSGNIVYGNSPVYNNNQIAIILTGTLAGLSDPPKITVRSGNTTHSVFPYEIQKETVNSVKMKVYDCNFPLGHEGYDKCILTFELDNGQDQTLSRAYGDNSGYLAYYTDGDGNKWSLDGHLHYAYKQNFTEQLRRVLNGERGILAPNNIDGNQVVLVQGSGIEPPDGDGWIYQYDTLQGDIWIQRIADENGTSGNGDDNYWIVTHGNDIPFTSSGPGTVLRIADSENAAIITMGSAGGINVNVSDENGLHVTTDSDTTVIDNIRYVDGAVDSRDSVETLINGGNKGISEVTINGDEIIINGYENVTISKKEGELQDSLEVTGDIFSVGTFENLDPTTKYKVVEESNDQLEAFADRDGDGNFETHVDQDGIKTGICGPNLAWKLYKNGTLTISGTGDMYDYEALIDSEGETPHYYTTAPWGSLAKKVVILPGVTGIGNYAFYTCYNMTDITIPNSVTRIGRSAFESSSLASATIPDSVTSIGVRAFSRCRLPSLTIPDSVTSIEMELFDSCPLLTSVTIPDSVTIIGKNAFRSCRNLTSVTIGDRVTTIEQGAFANCHKLASLTIPDSVKSIGDMGFCYCTSLKEITFEGDAPQFYGSRNFTNVTATAYYPADNPTWTEDVHQNYGGNITWVPTRRTLFSDVTNPDDFFYDPIYWAVDNGITTGYSDNTFRPNNLCHRAAVVTFLWRMAGKPDEGISTAFSDMTGNDDFDRAITWASNHGITTGYSDGTFRPYNPCHRAAIVTFLWRYASKPEPTAAAGFSDMTKNVEFDKAIAWAAENNITTGYNDGTFRPYNSCLRLAVVTFLYRYAHL